MNIINPIKLTVASSILQQSRKFDFQHSSSAMNLLDLTKILQIERLLAFSFKGEIVQSNPVHFVLKANFKATFIQLCVISLNPIKSHITHEIEQYYSLKSEDQRIKTVSIDYDEVEIDEIGSELNIGDIMLEALSLKIPLYPKKKNMKFEGVTITEAGLKPLEKTLNNPFRALKKLRE